MQLAPGVRLGPYELLAAIGAGGMGEVYRARDTRLDRLVAIKILPAAFAADPQLRERFDREARAISALNHPHICTLHDIGRAGDVDFLILEHLEGQTLAQRLERGPLSPAEALKLAVEIAGALATAHKLGVVHRDIKPANIMLTKSGAKLLDFGLAKAAAPVVAANGLSMLPTTPPGITAQGTILGTFQYMAPEQIEGLEADARTDIFAFGAVLFEMLTGRTAFVGKTRASLLGAILKDEPPRVSSLQPVAPPALDRIVSTCLAKDPDERYQSALDLVRDLKWTISDERALASGVHKQRSPQRLPWILAGACLVGFAIASLLAVRHLRETPAAADAIQFTIGPPAGATFAAPPGGGTGLVMQVALSPDGRQLAFVANRDGAFQLWLRPIAALDARPLPGTEDATFPFWSPDGRYIGFFATGKLKKIGVAGGPPIALCDAPSGRGGAWNRDNVIVFSPSIAGPLQRVSAAGGAPQNASALDAAYGESSHRFPSFLPDGRHYLFTGVIGTCCPPAKPGRIRIGSLDGAEATTFAEADSSAVYGSGHVLFVRPEGTLMATPFDAASRQATGDPFPVAERVASEGSRWASFSTSSTGSLVYGSGIVRPTGQLTWMDRSGKVLGTVGQPAVYLNVALSADERRLAAAMLTPPAERDIWILDVRTGAATRFTFAAGGANAPIWSPDDARIAFQAVRNGASQLRVKRVEGTTQDELVLAPDPGSAYALTPTGWSADSRYLVYSRSQGVAASTDVWAFPLGNSQKPFAVIQTPGTDTNGVLSPNGKWLAYSSTDNAATQIFVQPFPPTGGTFQVSRDGGYLPIWSADGTELFFISQDGYMMSAAVETNAAFSAATPTQLFSIATIVSQGSIGRQYAVTKDGRFLINVIQRQALTTPTTVVVNWLAVVQK